MFWIWGTFYLRCGFFFSTEDLGSWLQTFNGAPAAVRVRVGSLQGEIFVESRFQDLEGEGKATAGFMPWVGGGGTAPDVERALTRRVDFCLAVCPKHLPWGCAGGSATPSEAPKGCLVGQDPWQGWCVRGM